MVLRSPAVEVTCLVVLAATYVTLTVCIASLRMRWPQRVPYRWIGFLQGLRLTVSLALFLVIGVTLPHPIVLFALFVLAAITFTAVYWRSKEETAALNDLIRLVAARGGAVPEAVEAFAHGCGGHVALRAAHFAYRMRGGESVGSAIRRSGAPVMADAILAIQSPGTISGFSAHPESKPRQYPLLPTTATSDLPWRRGPAWLRVHTRPQLAYLLYLIVFSLLLGWFFRGWILPTLEQMSQEFSVDFNPRDSWAAWLFETTYSVSTFVCWLSVLWLCMVLIVCVFPLPWLLRMTPWYGEYLRTENRVLGLQTLAYGIDRGESVEGILVAAAKNSRSRWIRWRSKQAAERIGRGESIGEALRRSHWLTSKEAVWLNAAEKNSQLSSAFQHLSGDIARRYELRWQVRLAWLVPLTVLTTAMFVFAHGYCLFTYLMGFVHGLS